MTDDFQTQQDHLGSSELHMEVQKIQLDLLQLRKSPSRFARQIAMTLRLQKTSFLLLAACLQTHLQMSVRLAFLYLLLGLQRVRISLLNPFIKTNQSKDEDLSNNPVNKGLN